MLVLVLGSNGVTENLDFFIDFILAVFGNEYLESVIF